MQKGGIQYLVGTVTPRLDTLHFHTHTYLPVNALYSERARRKENYKVVELLFLFFFLNLKKRRLRRHVIIA